MPSFSATREPRASFDFDVSEDKIVQIIDQDNGRSVTNDIDNVLADIAQAEGLPSLAGHQVVYRDTTQRWDGVQLSEAGRFQGFYPIGAADQAAAVAQVRGFMQWVSSWVVYPGQGATQAPPYAELYRIYRNEHLSHSEGNPRRSSVSVYPDRIAESSTGQVLAPLG